MMLETLKWNWFEYFAHLQRSCILCYLSPKTYPKAVRKNSRSEICVLNFAIKKFVSLSINQAVISMAQNLAFSCSMFPNMSFRFRCIPFHAHSHYKFTAACYQLNPIHNKKITSKAWLLSAPALWNSYDRWQRTTEY